MIRAFRYGFNYLAPVGWYFDSASVYGRVAAETTNNSAHLPNIRPAGTDALLPTTRDRGWSYTSTTVASCR